MLEFQPNDNLLSNVSDAEYLHSNPDYFAGLISQVEEINYSAWFQEILNKIDDLISQCRSYERSFYNELNVESAEGFEKKYLRKFSLEDAETIWVATAAVINQPDFADLMGEVYVDTVENYIKKHSPNIVDDSFHLKRFDDLLQKYFKQTTSGGATYYLLDGTRIKKDKLKEEILDKVRNNLANRNGRVIRYIQNQLKGKYEKEQIEEIIRYFCGLIKPPGSVLDRSNIASVSGRTGFVLELAFIFLMHDEGWTYTGNIVVAGKKSGSDAEFKVIDKNNNLVKTYTFQLKNSFTAKDFGMIKIQDSLKYETLLDKIDKFDHKTKTLANYLVGNVIFLRSFGLDKNSEPHILESSLYANVKELLKVVLNAAVGVFLGEAATDFKPINNFFIFQGKYLIPCSAFFISAKKVLENYKERKAINLDTLGMVQVPGLDQFQSSTIPVDPVAYQKAKRKAFTSAPEGTLDRVKYPLNLLSYGGGLAEKVALGMSIKAFWYTWKISNIPDWVKANR